MIKAYFFHSQPTAISVTITTLWDTQLCICYVTTNLCDKNPICNLICENPTYWCIFENPDFHINEFHISKALFYSNMNAVLQLVFELPG